MSSQSVSRAIVISRSLSPLFSLSGRALSPLFSPSGRPSAELLSSFLVFFHFLSDGDKDHDDLTKDWRLLSLSAELLSFLLALSPPLSLLLVVCQPSYRLLSSLALFFLFDDDDDDDHTKDSG